MGRDYYSSLEPTADSERIGNQHHGVFDVDFSDGQAMPMSREESQWLFSIEYNLNATASVLWAHLIECWPIITIVLLTRFAHLLVDLILPRLRWPRELMTIIMGCLQINNYLEKVGLSHDTRFFIFTVILVYVTYGSFLPDRLLKASKKSESKGKINKFGPGLYLMSAFAVFAPILINEYWIYFNQSREKTLLRSLLMTLSMKLASNITSQESVLSSFAYFVHPASCIFGPWHPNIEVIDSSAPSLPISSRLLKFVSQSTTAFVVFAKALSFLYVSVVILDCITGELEVSSKSELITWPALIFFGAQEFRFSHYFICYLTLSFLTLWHESNEENRLKTTCKVAKVEWPRSLVEVVVYWNIPMHLWLKDYVFMPIKSQTSGTFIPIFITYLVSSALHGFKFHIWAVLLSFGLLTWTEYRLRLKLARKLSACVMANSCTYRDDGKCVRRHKWTSQNSNLVRTINFFFRILSMMHLAYLGCIFRGNSDAASYIDGLETWSEMHFYSHVILVVTFAISILV